MTHSKVSTLKSLIQWRLDEGIDIKTAYNTVVTNFCEGVTESERQELLEHFSPTTTITSPLHPLQVTSPKLITLYYMARTSNDLDSINESLGTVIPVTRILRERRTLLVTWVTVEELDKVNRLELPEGAKAERAY